MPIQFVDSIHGWAGRNPSQTEGVLRTTNGGTTWETVDFGFNIGAIGSISFIDTNRGWCSTLSLGKVYQSGDGGRTWKDIYTAPFYKLFPTTIQFVDPDHGFGIGRDTSFGVSRFWKTTDGGRSWNSSITIKTFLYKMQFLDSLNGWLVGDQIWKTVNGGLTWSKQVFDSTNVGTLYGVNFVNEQTGWCISSQNAWVIHTTDGGTTWQDQYQLSLPQGITLNGVSFPDSVHGWIFGTTFFEGDIKEVIYSSKDAGNTWQQRSIGLSRQLGSGVATDSCHAWAISDGDGSILALGMATSVSEPRFVMPESISLLQNYPNPFNPSTRIFFALSRRDHVSLKVFNSTGQEIQTILNDNVEAGDHSIEFSATDLSSGVYYFHLVTSTAHLVKKAVLTK